MYASVRRKRANLVVAAAPHNRFVGVEHRARRERDIAAGECSAVMPANIMPQLRGDRLSVGADAAVRDGRNVRRERKDQVSLGVTGDERARTSSAARCSGRSPSLRIVFAGRHAAEVTGVTNVVVSVVSSARSPGRTRRSRIRDEGLRSRVFRQRRPPVDFIERHLDADPESQDSVADERRLLAPLPFVVAHV